MSEAEPAIRIETREDLIYLLAEAAAIEHNLMACYLYAAWSLKRGERDGLTPDQAAAVARWRKAIVSFATEEMGHLALVGNLATAIGAAPHLSRPNFPIKPGYHPSGVVLNLVPFSKGALDHFIYLERPEGKELDDSAEFVHPADYHRTHPRGRLMPSAQDYGTIGHLYRGIHHGLVVLTEHLGERELFCGDPASQISPSDASLPDLMVIHDLATAAEAVETIVEEGEGGPRHSDTNHYARFLAVRDEYERLSAGDPSFAPAFPVARNPTAFPQPDLPDQVTIDLPEARRVLDIGNALYAHVQRCLVQAYGRGSADEAGRKLFVDTAIDLMFVLAPVATYLASLPASHAHPGVHAGMTFTTLRDVARLPSGPSEKRVMAERILEIAKRARHQFPAGHELAATAAQLQDLAARFAVPDLRIVGHPEAGK